jgi:hypothetical protein
VKVLLLGCDWLRREAYANPIGLLDLAGLYRAHGHDVRCSPFGAAPDGDFDVVGYSVFSPAPGLPAQAAALRRRYPRARVVIGGRFTASLSAADEAALTACGAEVWRGDGETALGDPAVPLAEYPAWCGEDLAALDVRDDNVMSTRGCPYHCAFCQNLERRVSFFSPERTARNVELLFARGVREIFLVDDIFTLRAEHMLGVLEACRRRGVPLEGRCRFFTHVNFVTPEHVEVMRRFRPTEVQIGIESGDDDMLRRMNKGFTAARAHERVRALAEAVPVNALFLVGFPGETAASLENTVRLAAALAPWLSKRWVSLFQPVPGTEGHRLACAEGTLAGCAADNRAVGYVPAGLDEAVLEGVRDIVMGLPLGGALGRRAG